MAEGVSLARAARELGVPYQRLYYLFMRGFIPSRKEGQYNLVLLEDVKKVLQERGVEMKEGSAVLASPF
jgi:hypothetical protein